MMSTHLSFVLPMVDGRAREAREGESISPNPLPWRLGQTIQPLEGR